ncbi:hypothetical protein [Phascolarctobacterium sp.]
MDSGYLVPPPLPPGVRNEIAAIMDKYKLNERSRRELLLAELRKIDKENTVKNFPDKVCELIAEVRKLRATISTVAFIAVATAIYIR